MKSTFGPRCPACAAVWGEALLVERRRSSDQKPFLGCERFPDCTHTEPLPARVEMIRAGARELPGFEEI